MGRFELLEMTHDKWSDDVWNGPLSANRPDAEPPLVTDIDRPRLYFYWGENDHWIDNSTRDSIIASRAQSAEAKNDPGKPHMEIDRQGTPHDFCIRR